MTTVEQVQQELEAWSDAQGYDWVSSAPSAIAEELWEWRPDGGEYTKSFEIPSGTVTLIEDHGGGEGDGEERFVVIKVGDRLFRYDGYYSSWSGTEWDDTLREVEPFEVTVIQYRVKKEN